MHGSKEDFAGVQRHINDQKRWEYHTLANAISCLVAQEHADRERGILALVGRELAADDQQHSSFLPFAYLGFDPFLGPGGPGASHSTTIAQLQAGGDVRIQSVCSRLRHQCWSYETLFQLRAMSAPDPSVFWLNFLLLLGLLLPFLPLHRCQLAFTTGRVLAVDSHRIAPGILRRSMMMFPLFLFLFFSTVGQMHTVRTLSGLLYISSCKKASMYETAPCIKGRLGVKESGWCLGA